MPAGSISKKTNFSAGTMIDAKTNGTRKLSTVNFIADSMRGPVSTLSVKLKSV